MGTKDARSSIPDTRKNRVRISSPHKQQSTNTSLAKYKINSKAQKISIQHHTSVAVLKHYTAPSTVQQHTASTIQTQTNQVLCNHTATKKSQLHKTNQKLCSQHTAAIQDSDQTILQVPNSSHTPSKTSDAPKHKVQQLIKGLTTRASDPEKSKKSQEGSSTQ